MKYIVFFFLLSVIPLVGSAQQGSDNDPRVYFVGLKTGEKFYAKRVQIKSPLLKSNYFLLDDSLKFPISAVKYYQNENGFYLRISNPYERDDFARRVISGRISKYSISKTYYNNPMGPYGYGPYGGYGGLGYSPTTTKNIYFFSKDEGELQNFNYENLREAMSDNPGSMEMLNKYRKDKYVETGLGIAGAAILIGGLANTFKQGQMPDGSIRMSPAVYVGVGIMSIPWITGFFKKDKITEAIEIYNYDKK